jgi:transcriptional regulator with XRE-family HTH domain
MAQQKSTFSLLKALDFGPMMPPMNSPFGNIIKQRLSDLKKTQEWLAEECGVSKNAVSKWIRDGKISRANAVEAARALGLTVDQLLGQALVDVSPPAETTLERLDAQEKRLLDLYRHATKDGKLMIYGAASVAPKDSDAGILFPRQ